MRYRGASGALLLVLSVGCTEGGSNAAQAIGGERTNIMQADVEAAAGEQNAAANIAVDLEDDGIRQTPEPYAVQLQGKWDLWQDVEGGRVCPVTLTASPVIGGYAVQSDAQCIAALPLDGEIYAWFVADDKHVVLTDATRKALARLAPNQDGSFYLNRRGTGLESVVLSTQ